MDNEHVRELVKLEQMMDSGEMKFVMIAGRRMAVDDETMEHFGLKNKQTISSTIALEISRYRLDKVHAEIAMRDAQENPE